MGADKGGIAALRPLKIIGVSWPTAQLMMRKLRHAAGNRDRRYRLKGLVEVDDALISGKRGRGAAGKKSVLICVQAPRQWSRLSGSANRGTP